MSLLVPLLTLCSWLLWDGQLSCTQTFALCSLCLRASQLWAKSSNICEPKSISSPLSVDIGYFILATRKVTKTACYAGALPLNYVSKSFLFFTLRYGLHKLSRLASNLQFPCLSPLRDQGYRFLKELLFAFSLSFSHRLKDIPELSRALLSCDLASGQTECKDVRNHPAVRSAASQLLPSIKPDLKEICKTVKQAHLNDFCFRKSNYFIFLKHNMLTESRFIILLTFNVVVLIANIYRISNQSH